MSRKHPWPPQTLPAQVLIAALLDGSRFLCETQMSSSTSRWLVHCWLQRVISHGLWLKSPLWGRIMLWLTVFIYLTREINYCWQMSRSKGKGGGGRALGLTWSLLAALPARGHNVWPCDARHGGALCLLSATPPWSSSLVSSLYPMQGYSSPLV